MANLKTSDTIIDNKVENPKILSLAGGLLFALGLVSFFVAFVQADLPVKVGMGMNAAILLSLGYPLLLYVRALTKIATLEKRLRELEQRQQS